MKTLDKKWKEILYSMSGLGPNLLMVILGAYFTDAINPAALQEGSYQAILSGTCFILPLVFPVLWMLAKIFDGIIDIPLAALTDTLKTKWGRRRPPIAVCFIPMVVSYAMCWWPVFGPENQLGNTIWIVSWAFVFFTTYTMCLIAFYGSLSTVCENEDQRLTVSSFKSFFDTISYCLTYALVPVLLGAFKIHINELVMYLLPLMATMIIPLFMIKEGDKYEAMLREKGIKFTPLADEPKVGIWESIKLTFTNKIFIRWCVVNCCSFFGLQMFLVSMNSLINGGMAFNETQMAVLNTCAFAPVPIMLYLFRKLKAKKGIRFAYQTCLLSFAVCILSFDFASVYVLGYNNVTLQYIIGCTGGVIGSWAIGSFFMMPYMIPAQISSVEEKLTGKNHSAMYFAGQAITTSVVGAIAGSLVYEYIKRLYISKSVSGVISANNFEEAAKLFGVDRLDVYNLGTLLVPIIVSVFCIFGFLLAFTMLKDYNPRSVAKALGLEKELEKHPELLNEEKKLIVDNDSVIVNLALYVLSGTIFGFIWNKVIINNVNKLKMKKGGWGIWLLNTFIPFYSVYWSYKTCKFIKAKSDELNVQTKDKSVVCMILSALFLHFISYSIIQSDINKISNLGITEEEYLMPEAETSAESI
ncbi:MAG: hypothetical protein E7315_02965 [Clostridiales bacterium]|nr:hypothetical protein [Clostridiales bacterium]